MITKKRGSVPPKQENPAQPFWQGMDYIIDCFHNFGENEKSDPAYPTYGIQVKSIILPIEEWQAIADHYHKLEQAVLDAWEDTVQIKHDLEEIKDLPLNAAEEYRRSDRIRTLDILKRLRDFVNNNNIAV
jgi:hypothetical protein